MTRLPYQRVDLERAASDADGAAAQAGAAVDRTVRWAVLPLALLLCIAQDVGTTLAMNVRNVLLTSTLIPVVSFGVLFILVLLINPMLRFVFRNVVLRPLNRGELVCIFGPMLVTSGFATFGVTGQLVPLIAAPWNPTWNTVQSGWREDLHPHLNSALYLTIPTDADRSEKYAARRVLDAWIASRADGATTYAEPRAILQTVLVSATSQRDRPTRLQIDLAIDMIADASAADPGADDDAMQAALDTCRTAAAHVIAQQDMAAFRDGVSWSASGKFLPRPPPDAGWRETWRHHVAVFHAIHWSAWVKPLGLWLIFVGAAYCLFYSLTHLVIDSWANREQLIFPLAALPQSLMPEPDQPRGRIPPIFRKAGFWAAFAVSFLVITWNVAVKANWLAGIGPINLGMALQTFDKILVDAGLGKASGFGAFLFVFTTIGLAFLLPLHVSFSAWFYYLAGQALLLIGVWIGYGASIADFPQNWFSQSNALTAMGGGGLMLFSAVSLYRCFKQNAEQKHAPGAPGALRRNLPIVGLIVGGIIMVLWLSGNWGGAAITPDRLVGSLLVVMVLTLMTLGIMRTAAEGSIYWMQYVFGFTHVFKMLGLGKILGPAFLLPLTPVLYVLFMDIKTFIAPNILNAAKMQVDARVGRMKYHLTMVTCLIVVTVVSIGFAIWLAHVRGANDMHQWWYTAGPEWALDQAVLLQSEPPEFDYVTSSWFGAGAGWVALTMLLRRALLWFPHPIGFLMFTNPLMHFLWFSFFLGWVAKKIVVRYGGKPTYDIVQPIFIGLIMGELIAVFLWPTLALIFEFDVSQIDLNRYGP